MGRVGKGLAMASASNKAMEVIRIKESFGIWKEEEKAKIVCNWVCDCGIICVDMW